MKRSSQEIQAAINVIAESLQAMADSAGRVPDVNFSLDWIDVSTIGVGTRFYPNLKIEASVTETVNIADL